MQHHGELVREGTPTACIPFGPVPDGAHSRVYVFKSAAGFCSDDCPVSNPVLRCYIRKLVLLHAQARGKRHQLNAPYIATAVCWCVGGRVWSIPAIRNMVGTAAAQYATYL